MRFNEVGGGLVETLISVRLDSNNDLPDASKNRLFQPSLLWKMDLT